MVGVAEQNKPELGIWIRFWDLALAFAALAAAFLWRQDKVSELRLLSEGSGVKGYFSGKPVLLDSYRGGYTFETVRDHLRAMGEKARDYYAHDFMPIHDLAMSLFVMTFLILFILYATQSEKYHALGLPSWVRKLLLLAPIMQFSCDVGENFVLQGLIDSFPRLDPLAVSRASLFTQLKWLAIYINALTILGLGGYTLYQWLVRPEQKA